ALGRRRSTAELALAEILREAVTIAGVDVEHLGRGAEMLDDNRLEVPRMFADIVTTFFDVGEVPTGNRLRVFLTKPGEHLVIGHSGSHLERLGVHGSSRVPKN